MSNILFPQLYQVDSKIELQAKTQRICILRDFKTTLEHFNKNIKVNYGGTSLLVTYKNIQLSINCNIVYPSNKSYTFIVSICNDNTEEMTVFVLNDDRHTNEFDVKFQIVIHILQILNTTIS